MDGLDWYDEEKLMETLEQDDEEYDSEDVLLMLGVLEAEDYEAVKGAEV